jgi:ketosteroid isomerase-like protein
METTMDDYEAIRQLVARYNVAFDNLDIEGWVDCFTEDAFFNRSNADRSYRGHDELRQLITEFSETFNGRHITTDFQIHLDGDVAKMSCYLQLLDRGNHHAVGMFAVYDDELRKVGGEWKFSQRLLEVDL